jgi:hypothetical protein
MLLSTLAVLPLVQSAPALLGQEPLSRVQHQLPHVGLSVTEERWLDPRTGAIQRTAFDASGQVVARLDALLVREQELALAGRGKLSRELFERVQAVPSDFELDVVFWLREPADLDLASFLQSLVESGVSPAVARAQTLELARNLFQPTNLEFAQRLSAAGFTVTLVGDYWPDVFARLPAGEVARWAAREEIDVAYYAFSEGGPEQIHAQGTMRTPSVHDLGISGAGGATKVLVNDCGEVTTTHSWLPPVVNGTGNGVASHPCGVAGNICMNGPTQQAAAKGLPQLYSHDGCGSDGPAQTAWSWGLTQGIDVGNCSWQNGNQGSIVFLDRFFDYTIRNFSVMMFKSNGNQGGGSNLSTSPGNGYNMTCSGAYNDGDNVNWAGDVMASYSSYLNPNTGHEKPELASPGDQCVSTSTSGTSTQNFNGTSSASPLTCGVGVLLANTNPAILASMPTLKAALMVGAWHNIEGAEPISDKDGAGGVHALASQRVIAKGQFENGSFTNASFPGNVYTRQIQLYQGVTARVIALWFSDPDAAYSTDVLKMDLDLTVLDPQGATVAASASTVNPFELVQFLPAQTGLYTVRLTKTKFLGTSEPYCIAWSTRLDAAQAEVTTTGTPNIGALLTVNVRDRYDPGAGFAVLGSFGSLPNVVPWFNGWAVPLQLDRYYRLTNGPAGGGLTGTLNAQGLASVQLQLPFDTGLAGQTLYISAHTFDPGNNSTTRGVAPATSVVLVP